jgi:hypothetical protein
MVDVMSSSVPGRTLAALGRGGRPSPMLVASVRVGRREADVAAKAAIAAERRRKRPRRARSRSRTREIVTSTI